jgi:hypothetical protein
MEQGGLDTQSGKGWKRKSAEKVALSRTIRLLLEPT